jgi:hypothetical protein
MGAAILDVNGYLGPTTGNTEGWIGNPSSA